MEPRISGTCMTGGGATYAYDGFWKKVERQVQWNAKVRKGGSVVGTPSGVLENLHRDADVDRLVKRSIEAAIDDKIRG